MAEAEDNSPSAHSSTIIIKIMNHSNWSLHPSTHVPHRHHACCVYYASSSLWYIRRPCLFFYFIYNERGECIHFLYAYLYCIVGALPGHQPFLSWMQSIKNPRGKRVAACILELKIWIPKNNAPQIWTHPDHVIIFLVEKFGINIWPAAKRTALKMCLSLVKMMRLNDAKSVLA